MLFVSGEAISLLKASSTINSKTAIREDSRLPKLYLSWIQVALKWQLQA